MSHLPTVYSMIVAAGRGSRFGASCPKQYVQINNKTLLEHSVARLATSSHINQCLLVIADKDTYAQTLDFNASDFGIPITYAIGGAERWQSVQAGVEAIVKSGAKASDLILIHDAARPAVPTDDINRVISAAMDEPYGAILAAPVADTLKQVCTGATDNNDAESAVGSYIQRTLDRSGIWQAQTPQVFRIGALRHALTHISQHHLNITDEASAFEYLDLPIRLIIGSRQNIKLTYPEDAVLLAAILASQTSF